MDSHVQFYSQPVYSRETFDVVSSMGAISGNPPAACYYAHNTQQGNYGGHTMAVVEDQLQRDSPDDFRQPVSQNIPSPSQPGAPPRAHQRKVEVQNSQGQGASRLGDPRSSPRGHGDDEDSTKRDSPPALQFPWMKTTKSHAHLWKAQWPGKKWL